VAEGRDRAIAKTLHVALRVTSAGTAIAAGPLCFATSFSSARGAPRAADDRRPETNGERGPDPLLAPVTMFAVAHARL
jgi:hypothetical protein